MCRRRLFPLTVIMILVAWESLVASEFQAVEHPFILWNRKDIAALRKRMESDPWAKAAYRRWLAGSGAHPVDAKNRGLRNLFRYAVLGDQEAGEAEKKELLRVINSPIPRGGAQWITVLRYDLLYDELTADERQAFEKMARVYIENGVIHNAVFNPKIFNDSRDYSRYDARKYTRTNWLPNIIWPRKVSANLMAVALRDEELIRKTRAAYGSWKWYFDEYLCDLGFYSEEFSKMGSTPGAMLLYCRGLERLGLDELGFGYTGKGGATMRGHIESLLHLGYPRVEIGSPRPHYPMITMGDLRQGGSSQGKDFPSAAFQHSLVVGYLGDGTGGNVRWRAHGAWGGTVRGNHAQWDGYSNFTPKMQIPLWFEFGHARWPDAGFDYFLAQIRGPDETQYHPSPLFGLGPIDPNKVTPPPAPSAVWPERGLVVLRADESPAYWQSPAPAVAMRLATGYAHSVNDGFALMGFYAFQRPIYLNRQVTPGYASGWSRSVQSHCGVTVDAAEPKVTRATHTRHAFTKAVKFAAARSSEVYPGVDLTRSLMLTREYLLDVTHLKSPQPHQYCWLLHALGQVEDSRPWKPGILPQGFEPLAGVRIFEAGEKPWSITALQTCAPKDPSKAELPKSWYDRKIGVRMSMLAEEGTTAYTAETPLPIRSFRDEKGQKREEETPSEVGGVTLIVQRQGPKTTFVALHEPFEGGRPRITEFQRVARTDRGVAVAIRGGRDSPVNDRAMFRIGDHHDQPLTLAGGGESFTFANYAYLRIGNEKVEASGDLKAMQLRVEGRPKLIVNGKEAQADLDGGLLTYGD